MARVKPPGTPRWSETAGDSGTQTGIVVPSSGLQDVGWSKGQRPPAKFENWFKNLTYQWLRWLQAITDPASFSGEAIVGLNTTSDVSVGRDLFAGGMFCLENATTPSTFSPDGLGNVNDYALAAHHSVYRVSANAIPSPSITGMSGANDGRVVIFTNVSANGFQFAHEDTHSAASNRFHLPGGTALGLSQDYTAGFIYDETDFRWRLLFKNF